MDRFKGNSEEKNIQLIIQSEKTIQAPIGTDMVKVEVRTSTGNKVIIDNVRLKHI